MTFKEPYYCIFLLPNLFITTLIIMCSTTLTHAYIIEVGGRKGWTLNPPESYSVWSAKMRFSVDDTLHFKYNKVTDSVLVVSKDDYDKCNTKNPITKWDGGDSSFTFDRSGSFYFITGNKSNCEHGQKIKLTVLTVRNNQPPAADTLPPPTTGSIPGAAISPVADVSTPPATWSSASDPAFNAASTVPFVVIISLGLAGFVGSA